MKVINLIAIALLLLLLKYGYDNSQQPETEESTADNDIAVLEHTMKRRLAAIPEAVKRRANISNDDYQYTPHQASYRVLMHLNQLFSGHAVSEVTRDCDQWYEEFAVQLKPDRQQTDVLFDYQARRVESLTSRQAEITTRTSTWVDGKNDVEDTQLRFRKINDGVELNSDGETYQLDPDTKLNIEGAGYLLRQIEQGKRTISYLSEPDDSTEHAIKNDISIRRLDDDYLLDKLWVVTSREYRFEEGAYSLDSSMVEVINDRAVTLYAGTMDSDGILFELILGDFEYQPSRCQQLVDVKATQGPGRT